MGLLNPFINCIVNGSSFSGKTTYLKRFITEAHTLFTPPPSFIIYVYKIWDSDFDELNKHFGKRILFLNTLPSEEQFLQLIHDQNHTLLCVDDALNFGSNQFFVDLFTCLGHHYRVTSIIVTQNLHHKGPFVGTICQNAHLLTLLSSPRDYSTILALGKQLGEFKLLRDIFKDAVSQHPFSYLVINLHPAVHRSWRYLTNILESDGKPLTVYLPN